MATHAGVATQHSPKEETTMFSKTLRLRAAATVAATLSLAAAIPAISTAKPLLPGGSTTSKPTTALSPCDALQGEWGDDISGYVGAMLQGNTSGMNGFAAAAIADKATAKQMGCAWAQ
jgi:hypothetical protein